MSLRPTASRANVLLINGSFEEGKDAPLGWNTQQSGRWESGTAHRGKRFARINSATEHGWESERVPLSPETDYRIEGWVRVANGEARLDVDLLDANGQLVRTVASPRVKGIAEWRYVAVEFNADAAQGENPFGRPGACGFR